MALYIQRVETVVSLKQLAGESEAVSAAPTSQLGLPAQLAPDAAIADIAGGVLPKYVFAWDAAPPLPRGASATDLARVPDLDMSDAISDGGGSVLLDQAANWVTAAALNSGGTSLMPGNSKPVGSGSSALTVAAFTSERFCVGEPGSSADDGGSSSAGSMTLEGWTVPQRSLLDVSLLAMWEERAEAGLFRYDVTACPSRLLPGRYGFVAQLNEGRGSKKRPTEFRVDAVVQPFDATKFNFSKAFVREALFAFEPAPSSGKHRGCDATATGQQLPRLEEAGKLSRSPHLVLINVSPIDYGHVLLCPDVLSARPQLADAGSLRLALAFAAEAGSPWLRVGFNSLGAFATINHLHFQAYYLATPLPVERAPLSHAPVALAGRAAAAVMAAGPSCLRVRRLRDYPVAGWAVEGGADAPMAELLGAAVEALTAANVPHNLLICDAGRRAFLFPQCYAERTARGEVPPALLDCGVNPAVWEISGHLVLKRAEDYSAFTETAAWELLAAVSLDASAFDAAEAVAFGGQVAV